jgi:hypothetical protein
LGKGLSVTLSLKVHDKRQKDYEGVKLIIRVSHLFFLNISLKMTIKATKPTPMATITPRVINFVACIQLWRRVLILKFTKNWPIARILPAI